MNQDNIMCPRTLAMGNFGFSSFSGQWVAMCWLLDFGSRGRTLPRPLLSQDKGEHGLVENLLAAALLLSILICWSHATITLYRLDLLKYCFGVLIVSIIIAIFLRCLLMT